MNLASRFSFRPLLPLGMAMAFVTAGASEGSGSPSWGLKGTGLDRVLERIDTRFQFQEQISLARIGAFRESRNAELTPRKVRVLSQTSAGVQDRWRGEVHLDRGPWRSASMVEFEPGAGSAVNLLFARDLLDASPRRRRNLDSLASLWDRISELERENYLLAKLRDILHLRVRHERVWQELRARTALRRDVARVDSLVAARSDSGMTPGFVRQDLLMIMGDLDLRSMKDSLELSMLTSSAADLYDVEEEEFWAIDIWVIANRISRNSGKAYAEEIDSLTYVAQRLDFEFQKLGGAASLHAGPSFNWKIGESPNWRSAGIYLGFSLDLGIKSLAPVRLVPISVHARDSKQDDLRPFLEARDDLEAAMDRSIDQALRAISLMPGGNISRLSELIRRKHEVLRLELELQEVALNRVLARLFRISQLEDSIP